MNEPKGLSSTPPGRPPWRRRTWILGLVLLAGLSAGVIVAGATVGSDSIVHPEPYNDPAELPPPAFSNWIRPDTGEFWIPRVWDDRTLPEEEKAKAPWYNPRWAPFSKCVAGAGFDTRKDRSLPFAQADLDALVRQVNAARPDAEANKSVSNGAKLSGIAGTFLVCADRWLALPREELAANGLRQLAPGEVPEP